MKRYFLLILATVLLAGCKNSKPLLPNVSGKAGEILVVTEKTEWEGEPGNEIRELLAAECPFLAQREPLYTLVNVPTGGFADMLKVHRNIVYFAVGSPCEAPGVTYLHDVWASPQCVIRISAETPEKAAELVRDNGKMILSAIEQAERDRVIRNCIKYEEKSLAAIVGERFGGSPHFPSGYKFKKATDNFVWIADEKQYTIQGVFIYRTPVSGSDDLTMETIVARRNAVLKENVPGMFENTWMTTSTALPTTSEYISYRGRKFTQVRGLWDVENDFMGGPFVSHSFYSPDGKSVITVEAFVYAPKYDKRQYLRQVESIIYSWDWTKK